jgi:hypothetical protein
MREQSRRKQTVKHWPSSRVGSGHWLTFELSRSRSERNPVARRRGETAAAVWLPLPADMAAAAGNATLAASQLT